MEKTKQSGPAGEIEGLLKQQRALADEITETFKALYPFNAFINEAINYQLSLDE